MATGPGACGLEHNIIEIHAAKKIYAKNLLHDVAEAMSLGKEWLNETPHKNSWLCCGRPGTCHCQESDYGGSGAKQDDDQLKSIVQQIMLKSTDFLRRITVPVEGQGGVTLSYENPLLLATGSRLKGTPGGSRPRMATAARRGKNGVTGVVRCAAASKTGVT